MSYPARILVIDDEPDMCHAVSLVLSKSGFAVEAAYSGPQGLERLAEGQFKAVVLDILMPGMNGIDVLKEIRIQYPRIAVMMLSAMDGTDMKVTAFQSDADDYVTKPFGIMELPARIRAILRRSGSLYIDATRRQITLGERRVSLSPIQFIAMQYLLTHAGRTVTHGELIEQIWAQHEEQGSKRLVNRLFAMVSALRRKIGGRSGRLIQSELGGYRLNPAALEDPKLEQESA